MNSWGGGGTSAVMGWREKLNWGGGGGGGGGGGTISAIDMEDMGRIVNRVDAEKTFQAVFLFLIHRFIHHPNKIQLRILTTKLLYCKNII